VEIMRQKLGTLEWSERNNGALTAKEKLHIVRNLAFLAAREASDVLWDRLGLIKPADLKLSDFTPPDTRMAKEADELARATHTQDLLFHSYRTYYFGAVLASYHKLKYDRELHFTAAILHDIGVTKARTIPLTECCFAVTGGRQARDFLITKGHPAERAQIVGDAISAHMNLYVPVEEYGAEAALIAKGAICDLFGFESRRIHSKVKMSLLHTYPAGKLQDSFLEKEVLLPGSRLEFARNLRGDLPKQLWIQDARYR
jgi:hypothetical protein